jgi:hypothetical protein
MFIPQVAEVYLDFLLSDLVLTFSFTNDRKDGLRKIANEIGERCNDEELDEIIEYCSEGDVQIDKEMYLRVCKAMRLF